MMAITLRVLILGLIILVLPAGAQEANSNAPKRLPAKNTPSVTQETPSESGDMQEVVTTMPEALPMAPQTYDRYGGQKVEPFAPSEKEKITLKKKIEKRRALIAKKRAAAKRKALAKKRVKKRSQRAIVKKIKGKREKLVSKGKRATKKRGVAGKSKKKKRTRKSIKKPRKSVKKSVNRKAVDINKKRQRQPVRK